jgi:hypothetical protein
MKPGYKLTIVSGSRLRRVSDDGKTLLDQGMHEGALVEYDTEARIVNIVESKDKAKVAYVVELDYKDPHKPKQPMIKMLGWVYGYECTPGK